MEHPGFPGDIDAVITWVDGNDPIHAQKRIATLGADSSRFAAADPTRFNDCGEIDFCIVSLLRFAPWLRRIYIISDGQQPALMKPLLASHFADRVRVVDHREIFAGFEQHLPTFSNRSIEALLWRIPGLAERFVYLNDDFQLLRPVQPQDFFLAEGGVVLRGAWRASGARRTGNALRNFVSKLLGRNSTPLRVPRPGNHLAQELSARMAGYEEKYFQVPHCPHPMRKSVLADYFSAHPDLLERNIAHRLRSRDQFLTVSLANHLELRAGSARVDNHLRVMRLKPSSQRIGSLRRDLQRADRDPRFAFGCVQSLDLATPEMHALVLAWLRERIAQPEQWLSQGSREADASA